MQFCTFTDLSIFEITSRIKAILESEIGHISTSGEVVDFKIHTQSSNIYFSITDGDSSIKVVIFTNSLQEKLPDEIKNGDKVKVYGRLTINKKSSQYQIIASKIEHDGYGQLIKLFEEPKNRLAKDGLFDQSKKRPIPYFPTKIGDRKSVV